MRFNTITSLLLATSGLATASPLEPRQDICPVATVGDWTWKISEFIARRPKGTYFSMIEFQITSTNEGSSLDFKCAASAECLEDNKFLLCGPNSGISFAFVSDDNTLIVKLGEDGYSPNALMGTTVVPNICRAGGNGPDDRVCEGVVDSYVSLAKFPDLCTCKPPA